MLFVLCFITYLVIFCLTFLLLEYNDYKQIQSPLSFPRYLDFDGKDGGITLNAFYAFIWPASWIVIFPVLLAKIFIYFFNYRNRKMF